MINNDKQMGTPFVDYTDTKLNIEALPNVRFGAHAVATDNPTAPFGVYITGIGWIWIGSSTPTVSTSTSLEAKQRSWFL